MAARSEVPDTRSLYHELPTDRLLTRAELWSRVEAYFAGTGKPREELVAFAKREWLQQYLYARCTRGYDKPPDWTKDDPIPPGSVPRVGNRPHELHAGNANNARIIYDALAVFQRAKEEQG